MRRTKAEAQQTRQQLLNAALEAFWKNGVTNTSMQAIADEAGMTRGALYWHFKNKEDLFEALFEEMFAPFMQKMNQVLTESKDALTQLTLRLNELLVLLEEDEQQRKFCCVIHLKCEHTPKNATITELAKHYHERSHQQVLQILAHCQQQGSLPKESDINTVALFLKSIITGLISTWILNPEISLTQTGKVILELAMHTIQQQIIST